MADTEIQVQYKVGTYSIQQNSIKTVKTAKHQYSIKYKELMWEYAL